MTDAEWQAVLAGVELLDEWTLVTTGICTLQDLGYRTCDGAIPYWKLRQMLDLTSMIHAARNRRGTS